VTARKRNIMISTNLNEEAWLSLRQSRFTASEIYKLMGSPRNKSEVLSETAKTYVYEKAAVMLTGQQPEVFGRALEWGTTHESEAFNRFSLESFDEWTYYGGETFTFIEYNEYSGYSPDGLGNGILEIKCPFNSAIHLKNATINNAEDLKSLHPEYYWQMQFGMLATANDHGIFVSYDPRMPDSHKLFQSVIELDDVKEDIDEKLFHAYELLKSIVY
jgi:hypothetical protein